MDFHDGEKPVSRLEVVKGVVGEFIGKRELDRIGLVVFGENAFTQCPVTLDRKLLLTVVQGVETGIAGDRTAIGAAIALGAKRLKDIQAKSKILILLTDGRHNAGEISPEEAAEAARAMGIKIYTIGVGREGPAPFVVNTAFGPRTVYEQVDLDEKTLKTIASIGQGKYFRANDKKELSEVYGAIDKEEKTEVKVRTFFDFRDLYLGFLAAAALMLACELFLRASIWRTIP
jgi:Ca-activated chloride channel family protein